MSILEEVLLEEYERSLRISAALEAEIAELPRGSVRARRIGGREYYYLQYREGGKVKTDYIKADDVDRVRSRVELRRRDLEALKEQRKSQKQIERALKSNSSSERWARVSSLR